MALGSFIAEIIVQTLIEGGGYPLGRLIVPIISLGHARVEKPEEDCCGPYGIGRSPEGKFILNPGWGAALSLIFLALLAIFVVLLLVLWRPSRMNEGTP